MSWGCTEDGTRPCRTGRVKETCPVESSGKKRFRFGLIQLDGEELKRDSVDIEAAICICFVMFWFFGDIAQTILRQALFVCTKLQQSSSKKLWRLLSGRLDKFDMSFGKSGECWQSTNNGLSIIQSGVNNWSSVLHKLLWASSALPLLTHTGSGSPQSFWLVRSCVATILNTGRNLKELFWCARHQPHSTQPSANNASQCG